MSNSTEHISLTIKRIAIETGFTSCGITHPSPFPEESRIMQAYIRENRHADMSFLENNAEKRENPSLLLPGTKSVIVLAANYYKDKENKIGKYRISRYASGKDYHKVLKKHMKPLVSFLKEAGASFALMYTDTAPVFERAMAVRAGLGFIGKNNCLIIPAKGSYVFLAEIFTDIELSYDKAFSGMGCVNCSLCIDACPASALINTGGIDASKCLSYLTVENKKPEINYEFDPKNWVFGCDSCQEVCPYNIDASEECFKEFEKSSAGFDYNKINPEDIDESLFDELFKASSVRRAGRERLLRNIKAVEQYGNRFTRLC